MPVKIWNAALTAVGRRMLRLPMHPRYSRMLVEASKHGCIPSAALCASLVSGRALLMRLGRDDGHIAEARELFEARPVFDIDADLDRTIAGGLARPCYGQEGEKHESDGSAREAHRPRIVVRRGMRSRQGIVKTGVQGNMTSEQ